ncbi:DEAD/DEAH box helicase [Candidatus Woesearchaeota archaeon]|nr:DEAD/DEAH box helicase [Candidatus Woesearchaeota archaeon]
MIKDLKPRLYQETILATCSQKNTLVVLPTGMGKSIVFIMLAAQRLQNYPKSKILVLAPTKPLCEQHYNSFKKFISIDEITLLTGSIKPEEREKLFEKSKIIISTPQGLENDLVSNRISFKDVSLLVLDECHRAVKDYSYVWLADYYIKTAEYPRILGLTASPGSNLESIKDVCQNIYAEAIEVRTEKDPDMRPYVQDVKLNFIEVEFPEEFQKIKKYVLDFIDDRGIKLKELNIIDKSASQMSKLDFIKLTGSIQHQIANGMKDFETLKGISLIAEIMKMQHALELLETQGVTALKNYFNKLIDDSRKSKSKAVQNLVQDLNFRSANILVDSLFEKGEEHPKFNKLKELLYSLINKDEKVIIFNNFRDNAVKIVEEVNKLDFAEAELFVGQSKKNGTGLSQKEQIDMLKRFRNNEFNVIVMTSVGEEGLDIPKVDHVIFFEPVSSAIRHVQRKGRTGRLEKGEVNVLVTKGTRDEIYRWSSFRKENKMYELLKDLKDTISFDIQDKHQTKLSNFKKEEKKEIIIYADHREKSSRVIKDLLEKDIKLELKQLNSADYILSDEIGVEYKTKYDFVDSIIDGRLMEQLKDLKYNFAKPIIMLEGDEDIYSLRKIHPNAIRGMLASITTTFKIPIINTRNPKDSAEMLYTIAKREQIDEEKYFTPHTNKRADSLKDQQLYLISSLPNIGLKLANSLLDKFKTPINVMNASIDELKDVDKIGVEKAKKIKEVLEKEE